jgi:hypothetical protein
MAGATAAQDADKRKRTRSPAYPFINLETALGRAKQFYDKEQRNAANVSVAMTHWGYTNDSSNGAQTIAALTSFGLLEDEGVGNQRKVRLTQNALRILLDARPDSREKADLIKQTALSPKIHQQLWDKWGTALPSDAQLRHTLLFDWSVPFNDKAVDGFIREYRDTISFARLSESDKVVGEVQTKGDGNGEKYTPSIGDWVQWEPKGVMQFREPKRITSLSPDGAYAFVEGNGTGLPVSELTRQEKPASAVVQSAIQEAFPRPEKQTMRQDIFSLTEGTVTIQWPTPLSAESLQDIKDWLKIVERKISRSAEPKEQTNAKDADG